MPRHDARPRSTASTLLAGLLLAALGACTPEAPTAAGAGPGAESATGPIAAITNPLANPRAELDAAMRKFMAASSYHASMHIDSGANGSIANELDFVAPDRYRMTMPGLGTQVIVGDTMYMDVNGRSMKMPLPADMLGKWRDPARLGDDPAATTVRALGRDPVDGTPARKYLVQQTGAEPVDVAMWIGEDDLPLQVRVAGTSQGRSVTTTIRYSRFNDASIEITPPQ